MIHSTYDHGDETPATQLTPRQLRAALADRGGALWVDVRAPTDADAAVLATSLRLPPPVVDWLCQAGPRPNTPPAEPLSCATLVDAGGAIDLVLGPNFVVTHDRGSQSHAGRLAAPAAPPTLRSGADGFAAQIAAASAADLEAAATALGGTIAPSLSEAARRPGEAGAALHAVQRRATTLAEAVAAHEVAVRSLRAAGHVRDAARVALDSTLAGLAQTASDVHAVAERARSAAPSAELLALAAIERDVAAMRRILVTLLLVILGLVGAGVLYAVSGWVAP